MCGLPFPDEVFASGSHVGELILWDASDWNILAYEHILWEELQADSQSEIRLGSPKPCEMSIQHLTTNGTVRRSEVNVWLLNWTGSVANYLIQKLNDFECWRGHEPPKGH